MDDESLPRRARELASLALFGAGVAHLLIPGRLLAVARAGYRLLDVEFRPGETATRRVRAVGLGMLAAALAARPRSRLPAVDGSVMRWVDPR